MKTKAIITFLSILILSVVSPVQAGIVYSNSIIEFGIEYTIQTDKAVYNLGEDVEMLFKVTNLGDEDISITCSRAPKFNFLVRQDDEIIWAYRGGFWWVITRIEILAGESVELNYTWDMKDNDDNLIE